MKNMIIFIRKPIFLLFICLMYFPCKVEAVSNHVMTEVETRLITAIENADLTVDLSDLNIQVNLYADRFDPEYQKFLSLAEDIVNSYGSYGMGSVDKSFCQIFFDANPSPDNTDPYGVGENDLTGAYIFYDTCYFAIEEKPDSTYLDELKATVAENYQKALSVVDSNMSDVEKALVLYDYIISASNYPDSIGMDEEGNFEYEEKYHSAVNLFYDGISVCSANAEAYAGLLRDNGIRAIMVESEEMDHSWVMLEIDGTWYHADPTWDNIRYEIFTECDDYTEDPWDLGAAKHDYFLKSDEEMELLEHYGWEMLYDYSDLGITELPIADQSRVWDNAFFSLHTEGGNRSRFNYVDGAWYYLDRNNDRVVVYQDDKYSELNLADGIKYVHGDGTYLFYCTNEAVFAYEPNTKKTYEVLSAIDYGKEAIISEMRVVCDRIDAVILNGQKSDGSYHSLSDSKQISALKLTEVDTSEHELSESETTESEEYNEDECIRSPKKDRLLFVGCIALVAVIGIMIILIKRR